MQRASGHLIPAESKLLAASWDSSGDQWVKDPVFSTCLCALILEVYDRFLSTGEASANPPPIAPEK